MNDNIAIQSRGLKSIQATHIYGRLCIDSFFCYNILLQRTGKHTELIMTLQFCEERDNAIVTGPDTCRSSGKGVISANLVSLIRFG